MAACRMKSGVTSSLSPNQNASTSERPMPALATSRILDSSRSWMAWRMLDCPSANSGGPHHLARGRHLGLRRCQHAHDAEPVAGALDVELHAGRALLVHHAHDERLLELVVGRAHRALLAGECDAGPFQCSGDG